MSVSEFPKPGNTFTTRPVFLIAVQLLALALLIGWCFRILDPFITPFVWAIILSVTLYPLYQKIKTKLKGRGALAAVILAVAMLTVFILPAVLLVAKTADEIGSTLADYKAGHISIPMPDEHVKAWPLIGKKVFTIWSDASNSLENMAVKYPETIKKITSKGILLISSSGKGLLLFSISIIISGILLSYSADAGTFSKNLFNKLTGGMNVDMSAIAVATIRNVVKGVFGVAIIQSSLVAIALLIADIPAAGVWALLCLILSIVQIGILPVSIAVIIYIWDAGSTTTATLLTIWMIAVGLSDNILKPWLLSKGTPVPMPVVVIGSLGGFLLSGFIGLFTGAIILSLGYKIFSIWLQDDIA